VRHAVSDVVCDAVDMVVGLTVHGRRTGFVCIQKKADDHEYRSLKRMNVQQSKKMGCNAAVNVTEIVYFQGFAVRSVLCQLLSVVQPVMRATDGPRIPDLDCLCSSMCNVGLQLSTL
jgi:hypothetical protein